MPHQGWAGCEQGRLSSPEDIFYLTVEARADLLAGGSGDWQGMIQARRAERDHYATITVPDTIQDWGEAVRGTGTSCIVDPDGVFRGIPISGGPVRFVRSMDDWNRVCRGDILVVSVIDPGMAPLFGVAGGWSPRRAGPCHMEPSLPASTDCRRLRMCPA